MSIRHLGCLLCMATVVATTPTTARLNELHDAIAAGDLPRLQTGIKAGLDINEVDFTVGTPLHAAVLRGSPEMTQILLQAGADVEAQSMTNDSTPLHDAAKANRAEIIPLLVTAKANLEAKDSLGRTPLIVATVSNSADAARALVLAGADPEGRDDNYKEPPLLFAAANGDVKVAEVLAGKADINVRSGENQATALHYAAMDSRIEMIRFLLARGADPTLVNKNGETAYTLANAADVKKLLQDLGAGQP
ncbi:ankyrin repeat domain-containing protein [Rhizobium sp. Root1220]|uniref:ankyrin repeat domain-containing protein n=1 Tax=Rhizobium sp. Root1220 TaxID=1736432 RepID=UPI000702092A|nr:ankyrin repeat domain-containing protein [Rhizobium sp. Root1220]KQV73360.1 hypothetical protein ASC90_08205 [Rhizobium sp. Root1220]